MLSQEKCFRILIIVVVISFFCQSRAFYAVDLMLKWADGKFVVILVFSKLILSITIFSASFGSSRYCLLRN